MPKTTINMYECDSCGELYPPGAIRIIWLKCKTAEGKKISEVVGEDKKGYIACPKCCLILLGLKVIKKGDSASIAVLDVKEDMDL